MVTTAEIRRLMDVVLGCESWWRILEKPEDLTQITDADINNVWYMIALKELAKKHERDSGILAAKVLKSPEDVKELAEDMEKIFGDEKEE